MTLIKCHSLNNDILNGNMTLLTPVSVFVMTTWH